MKFNFQARGQRAQCLQHGGRGSKVVQRQDGDQPEGEAEPYQAGESLNQKQIKTTNKEAF